MVAGHLTLKNGRYYAVLNYRNAGGQRKTKWISLELPEKGNKRKAEAELARLRAEFEPPKELGDLSSDMLFADYLLEWLEIAKGRLAVATYSSYAAMINKPIGPYFKREELRKYFPSGYTEEQMRRDIIKGLELLKRQRERNRDAR